MRNREQRRVGLHLLLQLLVLLAAGCAEDDTCSRPQTADWGCIDYREYLHFAASRETPGNAREVAVDGHYVYIADGYAGLRILNASNPYTPWYVGNLDTPHYVYHVAVSGSRACVTGGMELMVVDVSDRAAPRMAGRLNVRAIPSGVAVAGDLAVVTLQSHGLRVIDISEPESLRVVSSLDAPDGPAAVVFDGVYVRVAALCEHESHNWTVYTIDLSDPSAPRVHSGHNCPLGAPYDIAMAGSLAYVACSDGLHCFDVSDPDQIVGKGGIYISYGYARSVAAANGYAYVADEGNGLRVFDVSVPSSPRMVALMTTYGYTEAVATAGDFVYVLDRDRGLHVLHASQPPPLPAHVVLPGEARDVAVVGERAYVAAGPSGLVTADVTDPMAAHYLGQVATAGDAVAVASDGAHAFVAGGEEGVSVIDVADPLAPARVATVAIPGEAEDVALVDTCLCVAAGDAGLLVLGVSDPARPRVLSSLDLEGEAMGVAAADSLAFLAAGDAGLQIVDIADPRAPHVIGVLVTPGGARDVAVEGGLACVADWSYGVQVIDISDPAAPRILGTAATPLFALRVALAGATAYAVDKRDHLLVIDVSDPTAPTLEGTLDGADANGGVTVAGDLVYIAAGSAGLKIALAQCAP